MSWTVRTVAYTDPDAQTLIRELDEDMTTRYGGVDATPVAPDEFASPAGTFVVAADDRGLIGCAGLRAATAGDVELKRMYVRASRRREGHAARLLGVLEERSRALGFARLILETGTAQPEAMALYERCGYDAIPGFGFYKDEPLSRCYAKRLT
ncbi:GNAT family N-acetyltransferase [Allobranchiibius sp. CTAmp26]|uniref:GNAT family N-acetyltransferase n=1 Tax=Allobranchiibius sp. CTAmp26 TaxID=2815214 RepID=UPI001AA0C656|nr:GNAT family N-acetyltransferase [Allobranchiibius sp. CTAmp26]MBO1756298.1 GNAT family N-acetyltransferase [Allobranchiibius sp. CTAmp26]